VKKVLQHPLLWTAVVFIILPFVAGANPFVGKSGFIDIATTMVVFALFALGFNLLFGHLGELSFGHAMFFTIGAYATALYTKGFNLTIGSWTWHHGPAGNALVALAIGLGLAVLLAFLLARLVVPRSSGIYYSMITLARRVHRRRRRHPRRGASDVARLSRGLALRLAPLLYLCRDHRLRVLVPCLLVDRVAFRQRAARNPREQGARALPRLRRQ
jgi:hypothetical protein